MDEDYIQVLHFHNPHLIWVEVHKQDTFSLRQVGLFGVVPRHASMVDGDRLCIKSDRWDPRANEIVEEFFETNRQLTFKSVYRLDDDDDQSSIFLEQPHIFGEISLKKQDGSKKLLTTCLDNSVYAYKSKQEFWQMLTAGKIETVPKEDEQIDVIRKIIQYYKDTGKWNQKKETLYQYLSPAQISKIKETQTKSNLTVENLEKHLILTNKNTPKEVNIIQTPNLKQYQEFNNSPKPELATVEFVENVLKKLTVKSDEKRQTDSPVTVVENITKSLKKDDGVLKKAKALTKLRNKERDRNVYDKICDVKQDIAVTYKSSHNIVIYDEELNDDKEKGRIFRARATTRVSVNECLVDIKPVPVAPVSNQPERNDEVYVAYGPPMSGLANLVRKKVPRVKFDQSEIEEALKAPTVEDEVGNNSSGDVKCIDNEDKYSDDVKTNADDSELNLDNCRQNVANASSNSNDSNENDSLTNSEKVDLDNPKSYNDFIQSKQDKNGFESLKSCSVDVSDKQKQDPIIKESKKKNSIEKKNSQHKLLDIMRKRKEMAQLNSSSSSNEYAENKVHFVKHENRGTVKDLKSDDTGPKTIDTSSISSKDTVLQELEEIHKKLDPGNNPLIVEIKTHITDTEKAKAYVNPYNNLEGGKSVFVENLIQPLILAHSKNNNRILPHSSLRDIPFKNEIHNTLRNKQVKEPNRLQSVSWPYILRGHSMFMISAANSGKTLGYIPAVCNLVMDSNFQFAGMGPICIIVCATALSVSDVMTQCRMFLNHQRVVACYPGIDYKKLITNLVNGCDILVSTPSMLYQLLTAEIGVDLRRLTTLVFEDCERLASVYGLELKAIQLHVKQMLKSRTDKQVKVQYVLASRQWCDFMTPLAKKAPDTIVTFAAFHECVLYSKSHTSVSFVKSEKKVVIVVEFLKENNDADKLTVIVCRTDDEVELLQTTLTKLKYTVVACNNQMDINELYKLRTEVFTSILICCDANLSYLNVTYANYLIHYSMPSVYSRFCRRFAVLNDNYPSIFAPSNANVKIKILLEDSNVEQLPKILNFIRRCLSTLPDVLDKVASKVLEQKDLAKAKRLVPICVSLLSIGECADSLRCEERHGILGAFDEPQPWMPVNGIITFKIIHYNSAIDYSARLLTHTSGGHQQKYPDAYGTLCVKLAMFFSKEQNQRLHGEPSVGDICGVTTRKGFVSRCQVLKIIDYEKKKVRNVVINLIDEEIINVVRAVELLYLPEKFKATETHVVKVRLAGVRPKDKDVTFSQLATNTLKGITDEDEQLYLRGRVVMTVGKAIFVETLEACADLSAFGETVVKCDLKELLLKKHAIPNPDHLPKLTKLCQIGNLNVKSEPEIVTKSVKKVTEHRWAHLDENIWSEVIFSNTINAGKFFVRLIKFDKCVSLLKCDIKNYVEKNPTPVDKDDVCVKDIVLAEFPDDSMYERAIVEEIIGNAKVKCFFVDKAVWRDVAINKLITAPAKLIKQIPFQSIECRLFGIQPPRENWTEFSTYWLHDNCQVNKDGIPTRIYVKYIVKDKAEVTGGRKYGVILIDTSSKLDLVINNKMIQLNLASAKKDEIEVLKKPLDFVRENPDKEDEEDFTESLDTLKAKQPIAEESTPIPVKLALNSDSEESIQMPVKLTSYSHSEKSISVPDKLTSNRNSEKSIPIPVNLTQNSDSDCDWEHIDAEIATASTITPEAIKKIEGKYPPLREICSPDLEDIDRWSATEFLPEETEDLLEDLSKTFSKIFYKTNKTEMKEIKEDNTSTPNIPKLMAITDSTEKGKINTELTLTTDHFAEAGEVMAKISASTNNKKMKGMKIDVVNKDVSFDSDDTSEPEVQKVNANKNELSILDSDDTQSVLTETDKDITTEAKKQKNDLDSDDLNENPVAPVKTPLIVEVHNVPKAVNKNESINKTLKNDEVSKVKSKRALKTISIKQINKTETVSTEHIKNKILVTESPETIKRPNLVWRQVNNKITIKIQLIVDEYELESTNRSLKFSANQNEVKYAFDIELYGVIKQEKTTHANKGQYILIHLFVLIEKATWLKLATGPARNWIVYDVDFLKTSSGEEDEPPCLEDQRMYLAENAFVDKEEQITADDEEEFKNPDDVDENPYDKYND